MPAMSRIRLPQVLLWCAVVLLLGGCTRLNSSSSLPRATNPGMADALGPSGLSRDSQRYMANDAP
jgi:hypothetical protein